MKTWTQTVIVQLVSIVILVACAAAFGLARPADTSAPAAESPVRLAIMAVGEACGLEDVEVEAPAPVSPARRAFGASRCSE